MMADNLDNETSPSGLQLISPVFREGASIPIQYSCKGQNVNPPLNIFNVPPTAQSLSLILHDPDAPSGDHVHWLMWDIPTSTENIAANSVPVGAVQGTNGSGDRRYGGPCPPAGTGTHRYMFELYALDTTLALPPDTNREQLESAMQNHILEQCLLTGVFAAE
jgi:Raf kinase inhibitor-like YbhB/YbcL family protein